MSWQVHVYGEPRGDVAVTCAALNLTLHRFPWREAMRQARLERDTLYLVRPDGHVALASAGGGEALRGYFRRRPELGR
jgi:hypothetical protein